MELPLLLPVTRLEANTGAIHDVGSMILLPSDTYSDLLRYLARMAQAAVDDVTPFLQRSMTKETIRITGDMDLMREQPESLVVVVGLLTTCDKEEDGAPVEFHRCLLDEVVGAASVRSQVGSIQQSSRQEKVRMEGLCDACDKGGDGLPVEFHPCRFDEEINIGFRSPVGPIQRPPRSIVG